MRRFKSVSRKLKWLSPELKIRMCPAVREHKLHCSTTTLMNIIDADKENNNNVNKMW
jgi:hypothetical protein